MRKVYNIIVMIFMFGIFANESFGIGSCTGPCCGLIYTGGQWVCRCCDLSYCESACIGGTACLFCGGDPTKECCGNGPCYNPATQTCCGGQIYDINNCKQCVNDAWVDRCPGEKCCPETGNCCDTSYCEQDCVNGECKECGGDLKKCCINGSCVDPICDNCHSVSEILYECFHYVTDPNGTPCLSTMCIQNALDSATCDYKGPSWPCNKSKCNTTKVNPWEPDVIQTVHNSYCQGGIVDWVGYWVFYEGCDTCVTQDMGPISCKTYFCTYNIIFIDPRGWKRECGKCP